MNNYSPNTRIEPTPKGWLFLEQSALETSEKISDPKRSAELRRRAKGSIVKALEAIDEKQTDCIRHQTALVRTRWSVGVRNLTRELRELHGRAEVAVQVFTDDLVLGLDTAIPLGLIANVLILNCFKHAFPAGRSGLVNVSIEYLRDSAKPCESLDGAALRLRVQDDGTGLPVGLEVGKADSLGLRLVHLLARQLHGEVQAVSGAGSTLFVSLPSQASSQGQVGSNSGKSPHSNR